MSDGSLGASFWITYVAVMILVCVLCIAAGWKIFEKAGKPGWACIVPVYNIVVILDIVNKPLWWILLMFIPLVNIVVGLIVLGRFVQSFGKGVGFAVGLIFLPFIFYPILGFGDAKYTRLPA